MLKVLRHALCQALCALLALTCCEARRASSPPREIEAPTRSEAKVSPLPESITRGVCLAHSWQRGGERGYGSEVNGETLDHLAKLGSTSVSLTPFGWMESASSATIGGEHVEAAAMPRGGETRDRVREAAAQARARGMEVMLKPHIWIRGGAWRGGIDPGGEEAWSAWWASYRAFLVYYAELAEEIGADSLVVGVELVSAVSRSPQEMVRTIWAVREVYSGELTYSANWDEQVDEAVWRELDAIGAQLYPPLSEEPLPSVELLRRALRVHLERWSELAERLDRPLWLTEVGYTSSPTSVSEPFGWPERMPEHARRRDEVLQRRAYEALFSEVPTHPRVKALYLWKYFSDPDTDEEGEWGFSPRGKLAERAIREAFAKPSTDKTSL